MSVSVDFITQSGGQFVTDFSDSFARPDQPFYLGDDWYTILTSSGTVAGVDAATVINVNAGKAVFGDGGLLNLNGLKVVFFPVPIDARVVRSRSLSRGLFSQMKIVGRVAGVDCEVGPMVFGDPNSENCYWLGVESISNTVALVRGVGTLATVLVANAMTALGGDTVRIEANFTVSAVTVRSYLNGALQNTFVDNTGFRVQTSGLYGIAMDGVFSGQLSFQDFTGGVL